MVWCDMVSTPRHDTDKIGGSGGGAIGLTKDIEMNATKHWCQTTGGE